MFKPDVYCFSFIDEEDRRTGYLQYMRLKDVLIKTNFYRNSYYVVECLLTQFLLKSFRPIVMLLEYPTDSDVNCNLKYTCTDSL